MLKMLMSAVVVAGPKTRQPLFGDYMTRRFLHQNVIAFVGHNVDAKVENPRARLVVDHA